MSYKKTTIKKIITDIEESKIFLPAIQRKFVWGKHQIELLFDSLMREYPIGTFLFWRLRRQNADSYVFYDFLKEYDQRNPYNRRKTGCFISEEIIGVLDGQQRLSSMYVGLMGTHREKEYRKRINDPDAYPKTSLYLNMLSLPYKIDEKNKISVMEDRNFEFKFLSEEDAKPGMRRISKTDEFGNQAQVEEPTYWLQMARVLSWDNDLECDEMIDGFIDECQADAHKLAFGQNKRLVKKGIESLHSRINKDELLNYFDINRDDLEDILKIFIRVNSGGTPLNKTDLLFSTIVATWDDGRDKIEDLLKKINGKGDKFNFTNEYLMRCCLVLTDAPVLYKVNSFKSENVQKIRKAWPAIESAINKTVDLLVEFGFSGSLLTSQNATIIVAYYIYKGGALGKGDRLDIRKYMIHALLNGIFGSSQDQLINALRNAFREEVISKSGETKYQKRYSSFQFDELLKIGLPGRKSLAINKAEIEHFLGFKKGAASFLVLSLLYPNLRYRELQFHQDHIHPASKFNDRTFDSINVPAEQREQWLNMRDCLPNLQLMEGRTNEAKNATPLLQWMNEKMSHSARFSFRTTNYFPQDVGLEFSDFVSFYEQRREVLRAELMNVLAIADDLSVNQQEELEEEDELYNNDSLAEDERANEPLNI